MEIRCGKCNKLFRVSDDKITGKGIKFACSRCGEAVKITREEFETYTLSKAAVSTLDMFEPKPKLTSAPFLEPGPAKAEEGALLMNAVPESAAGTEEQQSFDSSSAIPDFLREKDEPASAEPNIFEEPSRQEEQPVPELSPDLEDAFTFPSESELTLATKPTAGSGIAEEPKRKQGIEAALQFPPDAQSPKLHAEPERPSEPAREPKPVPRAEPEPKPKLKQETAAVAKPRPAEPKPVKPSYPEQKPPATPVAPSVPKREPTRPTVKQTESEVPAAGPSHSNRMVLVFLIVLVLLGAAGYGVYRYILPSLQKSDQPVTETTSIDGLRIVNPSGAMEANGDLLISGVVENLTDKERAGWYVVVDVYDAQGTVLNKIRVLNGKQLYTRKDYDVLAQRGRNVQELKAKILQEQGVVIPARGSVPFEMRYFQPPSGIASFNAVLKPFDPARLSKEIGEAK
ncbi:MAG: zinc-ribbon domain-containing protein [Nitrospiraceae bacterium]|nr:zinc-ribbon domain-containing protein [Nitrospiraceae bacterium]